LLINIKESNRVNIFLFAFFFINNLYSLAHYATIYSESKTLIAILLVNFTPLFLLVGPVLYFYIRGLLRDDYRLSKLDWLHFIPALLLLINITPHLFSSFSEKLEYANRVIQSPSEIVNYKNIFIPATLKFILRPFFGLLYIALCIRMVYIKFKDERPETDQSKLIFKWTIFLIFNTLLVYVSFLIFTIFSYQSNDYKIAEVKGFYFLISTLVGLVLLNISLLFFPNILYGLPQLDYVLPIKNKILDEETSELIKRNAKSFEISQEKLKLLDDKIQQYILSKPYLNPDFNLSTMSADTDIPVHHLSYYFNEHLNINFNTWKNDHKINHIIFLIENGSNEMLTLDALAKQAGFGSRTTFFNAFKQKTGLTPSEYLNKRSIL
jgi:AraC-like DNA-binding protein